MMHEKLVAGIKVKNEVMREFNGTIFLPFGSDYSIFLYNLNTKKVQINIEVDGKDILNGDSLLIEPNEKLDLERWLVGGNKKGPKLKFIEKTNGIRETKPETGMDGIVRITYQFEAFNLYNPPVFRNLNFYGNEPYSTLYTNTAKDSPDYNKPIIGGSFEPPAMCSYANSDGFTVKGEESNQEFRDGYIGELETNIHTVCFNLKGGFKQEEVKTPITVKTKITCDACNKKNKSSYKFCTQCGNNLKYSK